jgi:hypothetical protein
VSGFGLRVSTPAMFDEVVWRGRPIHKFSSGSYLWVGFMLRQSYVQAEIAYSTLNIAQAGDSN